MERDFLERRRHIRVYFETMEEMGCELSNGAGAVKVPTAAVLDLSLGGIHLAVTGDSAYAVGDWLTVSRLNHQTGTVSTEAILMEIRWIFAPEDTNRIYLGCQFLELPEESRSSIANLINVKLLETSSGRIGFAPR